MVLTADRLKASPRQSHFAVTANGKPVGIIDDGHSTFEIRGEKFVVTRVGFFEVKLTLKRGDTEILTVDQTPLRNRYSLTHGGKELIYKATNMLASKFGLFEGGKQTDSVFPGPWPNRMNGITADLPADLPLEIQMFLLQIFISSLNAD